MDHRIHGTEEAFLEAFEVLRAPGQRNEPGALRGLARSGDYALPAATTCTGVTAARSSSPVRIL
jgi:hypothetical protein